MAFDKDVPLSADQIAADLVAINANWEFVIKGDGTANRVFRAIKLLIEESDSTTGVKCTVSSEFNGDTIAETDDIEPGSSAGDFSLSAGAGVLTVEASGLTGNCVWCAISGLFNATGSAINYITATTVANDIVLSFYTGDAGAELDLGVGIAGGETVVIYMVYITDA